jgi:uncharacterized protein YbbC (DUF1343 family)
MITKATLSLLLIMLFAASFANAATQVKVGAKILVESGFTELHGKHVGLVANQTSVVDGAHLIDTMHTHGVNLLALFSPEHGLRGAEEDGVKIAEHVDKRTGVTVYSLYGKVKKPTPDMMRGLDVLLYDIQDVGARFYTYISTMGLAMQAAAEAHIPFVVLDRPNPLGGEHLSGFVLEKEYHSFVGEYSIPVVHGLTSGELALMIKGQRMLPGLEELDLRVIRMEDWRREMQWPETGLQWTQTSPNIPDFETALLYPGICFLEGTAASEGRGTQEPFRVVGLPGLNADALAVLLNDKNLHGVRFEPVQFTPRSIPGKSSHPKFRDRILTGVRLVITDPHAYRPVETGVQLLCALYNSLGERERKHFFQTNGFDLLAGTGRMRRLIQAGMSADDIIAAWQKENELFAEHRKKYLLY